MHPIKHLFSRLAVGVLSLAANVFAATTVPANPSGFIIHRGINISHWLSQDFRWAPRDEWFTAADARYLASIGYDHLRFPVDEIELWQEDGSPNEAAFAQLHRGIEWARAAKLRVLIDLHSVRAHHFNASNEGGHNTLWTDSKAQTHFVDLWRELSKRLKGYPNEFLAYELMNEPTAPDDEDWNKVVDLGMKYVRSVEPDRVVVIGSNMWKSPARMPKLKVPEGDKNIILSIHTYAPNMFSVYRATWEPKVIREYAGGVNYPGAIIDDATVAQLTQKYGADPEAAYLIKEASEQWDQARMLKEYEPAIETAKKLGLQLYCAEFGVLPTVPRAARLSYYRDIVTVFEANGIAWANWEYKGDFGILEWHGLKGLNGAPDVQLIDALLHH